MIRHIGAVAAFVGVSLAAIPAHASPRAKALVGVQELAPAVSGTGAIGDRFGRTLARSGDTLAIGTIGDEIGTPLDPGGLTSGSVSIYRQVGADFELEATVLPSDSTGDDRFGFALALDGDLLAVGAPFEASDGIADRGAVYVYRRTGTQWQQVARLLAPDGSAGDQFGIALALDAGALVVGAPRAGGTGRAYHYARNGTAFALATAHAGLVDGDDAGRALALTGDAVFVGAPAHAVAGAAQAGAVLCFARAGGACSVPVVTAALPRANARYGATLAAQGARLLVGAPGEDGVAMREGATYVYDAGASVAPVERARLVAPDAGVDAAFGSALSIDAATLAIGAPGASAAEGAAYVFVESGPGYALQRIFSEPDGGLLDLYGAAVALQGDSLAVGVELDSISPNRAQGSVATWVRSGTTWSAGPRIATGDGAAREQFGNAVALDGTLAVVGSPFDDPAIDFDDAGTAAVYVRAGPAWTLEARLVAQDAFTQDLFGFAADASGDRVVVGAPRAIVAGRIDQGAAYVFRRDAGGLWTQEAKLVAPDGIEDEALGAAVAIDGDTAVVGAPFQSGPGLEQGAAYAFRRIAGAWQLESKLTAPAFGELGAAGLAVAIDGDTALVGAPDTTVGESQFQGTVHVFVRSAGGWRYATTLVAPDGAAGDAYGSAVAIDGVDIVVGAAQTSQGELAFAGAAYAYTGTNGAYGTPQRIAAPAPAAGDFFGASVSVSAGRVLVASPGDDAGGANAGAAHVFERIGPAWTAMQSLRAPAPQAGALFGSSVALGPASALVGEPRRDRANPDEGAAHAYSDDERLFADGFE